MSESEQGSGNDAAHDDDGESAEVEQTESDESPAEDDEESGHGTRQPGADPEDEAQIEEERERRLDPENRPDNAEVDNTPRDFDAEKGMFTDSEGYDEAEKQFPAIGDQGA